MNNDSFFSMFSSLIRLALPISAGRLVSILTNFISMMMLANLGKEAVAASLLAVSSTLILLMFATTIFYAVGIRIRYQIGVDASPIAIGILIKNALFLALLLAIPTSFTIHHLDMALMAFGQDPKLVSLTSGYFHYTGLGVFPALILMVISQFYVGIGKPGFALGLELIKLPLILISAYGFILGRFGLPQLGLTGLGLANLLAQSFALLLSIGFLILSPKIRPYRVFKFPCLLNWSLCRNLLSFGLPIGIQFGGELGAIAALVYLMGYFGIDALAALQVSNQYSIFIVMISFGLSQALSLKISEALGKKNPLIIKQYLNASMLLFSLYLFPASILFLVYPDALALFYLDSNQLEANFAMKVRLFFSLSIIFLFLDGLRNLLSGALRGLNESKSASKINLIALWGISVPLGVFATCIKSTTPIGLRVWFLSGFLVAVLWLASKLSKIRAAYSPKKIHQPIKRGSQHVPN